MSCVNALYQGISRSLCRITWHNSIRTFSACNNIAMPGLYQKSQTAQNSFQLIFPTSFLAPTSPLIIPAAGMKKMGKLRRRCKNCFFIMIDERLHVWCDVHPRHKQMQMIPQAKTVIVTTHATQGKIRPW